MRVYSSITQVPADFGPSAVAIGKFDGVHLGHRALIERLEERAAERSLATVVVTFDRNPLALLAPDRCPDAVVGVKQKTDLLASTGIDAVVVLAFDETLAAEPAEDFVRRVLVDSIHAEQVLVGDDFRFGAGGRGTPALLQQLGTQFDFETEIIPDVFSTADGRRVSSSWVRELLSVGDVQQANELLGRDHTISGEIVHGLKRGRELGFPTANLAFDAEGFVPADGVYAGWLTVPETAGRAAVRYPAAISVGTNPTFDDVPRRQVEAYVLDETELDLYGLIVEVDFVDRIRGMLAFDGISSLVTRMHDDVARVRDALGLTRDAGSDLI